MFIYCSLFPPHGVNVVWYPTEYKNICFSTPFNPGSLGGPLYRILYYSSYEELELLHYSTKIILEYAFKNVTISYEKIKYNIFGNTRNLVSNFSLIGNMIVKLKTLPTSYRKFLMFIMLHIISEKVYNNTYTYKNVINLYSVWKINSLASNIILQTHLLLNSPHTIIKLYDNIMLC